MEKFDAAISDQLFGTHLKDLINVSPLEFPSSHTVYHCITKAIDQQQYQLDAIHLLGKLAMCPCNRDDCLKSLLAVGGILEHLLSKECHNPSARLHMDVLSLLTCVCAFKIDAAQLLELYNQNVPLTIDVLCALIPHIHSLYPLSCLVKLSVGSTNTRGRGNNVSLSKVHWKDAADLIAASIRCIYELTTWNRYKLLLTDQHETDIPMVLLQQNFVKHILVINKCLTNSAFLTNLTTIFEDWLDVINGASDDVLTMKEMTPVMEAAVSNLLLLISNMMSFTNQFSAKFRQYATLKSNGLIEKVLIPMLFFELGILERVKVTDTSCNLQKELKRPALMLQLLLKILSLLAFKTKYIRPFFRQPFCESLITRLIGNEIMMSSDCKVEYFALVVRLAVNAELANWVPDILNAHSPLENKLTEKQRLVLALRLNNPAEKLYPIDVFSGVYRQLRDIFTVNKATIASEALQAMLGPTSFKFNFNQEFTTETVGSGLRKTADDSSDEIQVRADAPEVFTKKLRRRAGGISVTERLRRRREAFLNRNMLINRKKRNEMTVSQDIQTVKDEDDVWEDIGDYQADDDDAEKGMIEMTHISANNIEITNDMKVNAVPTTTVVAVIKYSSSPCSTTHKSETSIGMFDDSVVEEVATNIVCSTNVGIGGPAPACGAPIDDETAAILKAKKQAMLNTSPDVVRLTKPKVSQKKDTLDDVELIVEVTDEGYKGPYDLRTYRNESPPFGCPDRYLCALTRQFMINPVISPNGDVFEKESIIAFIKDPAHKHKCPITGEDLYGRDLVVDGELKRELAVVRANYI
eukprot:Tbor_TRINITY_DN115_c0_g1::TRINITY_DN115_c0_g1_i1::g.11985::m.11985